MQTLQFICGGWSHLILAFINWLISINSFIILHTYLLCSLTGLSMSWSGIASQVLHSVPCLPNGTSGNGGNRDCSTALSDRELPERKKIDTKLNVWYQTYLFISFGTHAAVNAYPAMFTLQKLSSRDRITLLNFKAHQGQWHGYLRPPLNVSQCFDIMGQKGQVKGHEGNGLHGLGVIWVLLPRETALFAFWQVFHYVPLSTLLPVP